MNLQLTRESFQSAFERVRKQGLCQLLSTLQFIVAFEKNSAPVEDDTIIKTNPAANLGFRLSLNILDYNKVYLWHTSL